MEQSRKDQTMLMVLFIIWSGQPSADEVKNNTKASMITPAMSIWSSSAPVLLIRPDPYKDPGNTVTSLLHSISGRRNRLRAKNLPEDQEESSWSLLVSPCQASVRFSGYLEDFPMKALHIPSCRWYTSVSEQIRTYPAGSNSGSVHQDTYDDASMINTQSQYIIGESLL